MITLISIGNVDRDILGGLKSPLEELFKQKVRIGHSIALPQGSWNQHRRQHLASLILEELSLPPNSADRILGVVDADVFAPRLNYVFGVADTTGRRALVSLPRLRQEYYDQPHDGNLFRQRVLKEAIHELGHTYGLAHCPKPTCVMHFSNSLPDTDLKSWNFCPICWEKVNQKP